MAIVTRAGKGSELTWNELDNNFTELEAISSWGTATDYSEFEADGTYMAHGDATVFDDLQFATVGLQQQGLGVSSNIPEAQTEFTNASNLSDYVVVSAQMPHSWIIGSVVFPHIHWMQTTNAVPNFLFRYRWQTAGEAKVTAWTDLPCNTAALAYTAGTMSNIATTAAGLTPPGTAAISDILQIRLFRDNANTSGQFAGADPVAATAAVTSLDVHVEKDTLGSRQEYIK